MRVLCFIKIKLSVKVELLVSLLCVGLRAILPAKAVREMTYTVLGGTINPTHSPRCITSSLSVIDPACRPGFLPRPQA